MDWKAEDCPSVHASFQLMDAARLDIPQSIDDYEGWHYLSHRIARNPGDLLSHTRRVLHARTPSLNRYLPGALHDLFFTLENAGFALRSRLYAAVRPMLAPDHARFFELWLEQQQSPNAETPDTGTLNAGNFDTGTLQAGVSDDDIPDAGKLRFTGAMLPALRLVNQA